MKTLELLAPAKNLECGKAAIDHGADAVYIGAPRFGARSAAGNSLEDIEELCDYAHQFGARIFVTVNTIIYNNELEDTIQLIRDLDEIRVDAVLIQDLGLYNKLNESGIVKECRLEFHASTQTDNRSSEKVAWLSSLGFKRVVLARELSIDEIAQIHECNPQTELEVFVHGALCVSYSGQCYASQYCFNRSANRGECAQFCRLAFNLTDANDRILERDRHLLSLRDMAQINNLERLAEAGAVSFKIEGRLKDVDYVKNVTAAYSQRLNEIIERNPEKYCRASFGHCTYSFEPNINKSFNRGFTTYFADGRDRNLVSFDTPKAMGEPVGKVKELRGNSFNVAGTASFSNGDGLCFLNDNHQLVGFRVNRAEGNRIFPLRMPSELRPGTLLFRNLDQAFNSLLSKPSAERKLAINFAISTENNVITLSAKDECGREATVTQSCELQEAAKPQHDNIVKQLSKLGGTVFVCMGVDVKTHDFIPSRMLAQLRRDVVENLLSKAIPTEETCVDNQKTHIQAPQYDHPYLYNASNDAAKSFYDTLGIENTTAFETSSHHGDLLMQCRYCLRNEMGYCTKNGKKAPWKEPLRLTLPDGKSFEVKFNCAKCQMEIYR